ncbi:MAG: Na+/H+ antiporter subunit C [Chitinophagaceae bacterium]|nr:MAG: Na+/H+ antiporter subunit C [Chitinophagaceae bacterium]
MELVLAIVVGSLYAASVYMLLRRSLVRLIIGLILLGHASNLFIFSISRLSRGIPPLIEIGENVPPEGYADPLPQALILTAIVIGFGIQAFAIVLIKRVYLVVGTDDLNELRSTDTH